MIDNIDRQIIIKLQKDGRRSATKLAQELGLSVSSVTRRLKRLTETNIMKVVAVPNPDKVGHKAKAMIFLNIQMNKIDDVCNALVAHPDVHLVGISFGRFDAVVGVYMPSAQVLGDFVKNHLSSLDGISHVETLYINELKKRAVGKLHEGVDDSA